MKNALILHWLYSTSHAYIPNNEWTVARFAPWLLRPCSPLTHARLIPEFVSQDA